MIDTNRSYRSILDVLFCLGGFAFITFVVVLADLAMLSPDETLTREGGGIETMTMLGYLTATAVYLWRGSQPLLWPVPVLLLAMALREFDADKIFTSQGMLSTKILLHDTPIWEKALALFVWAALACALGVIIRSRGQVFLSAIRRRAPWALTFLAGLLLLAFSKTIDGLARKLMSFGIEVSRSVERGTGTLEEIFELLIPALFMAAIFLSSNTRTQASRDTAR